jgi:hypothetical protein
VRACGELAIIGERSPMTMPPSRSEDPIFEVDTPYFPVARQKLIVMSMTTLSMYQIYWFYKNYERVRARTGGGGSPFWRAVAAPITARGLFAQVRTDAQTRFIAVSWSAGGLAVIYLGLTLLCFFDYPWWTLALGSVFALLPAHATMEEVNRKVAPNAPWNDGYSVTDVVFIVLGIALTILGLYLTRRAQLFLEDLLNQL